MGLKEKIDQDLKVAMLSGDKQKSETLKGLKSAILYAEVAKGVRDQGLGDEEILQVLSKEAKKRQESIDLFKQAGDLQRANNETQEKAIIDEYLPEQLGEEKLGEMVQNAISKLGASSLKDMGPVIGEVKNRAGGSADGAVIAKLVKQLLE